MRCVTLFENLLHLLTCKCFLQLLRFGNVTTWKLHGTNSIRAKVDTAWCQYKHAPSYIASVTAPGTTWQLAGTHSIMEPTARDFVVQLYHRGLRGAALLKAATTQQWGLSWIADGGHQSGRTARVQHLAAIFAGDHSQ